MPLLRERTHYSDSTNTTQTAQTLLVYCVEHGVENQLKSRVYADYNAIVCHRCADVTDGLQGAGESVPGCADSAKGCRIRADSERGRIRIYHPTPDTRLELKRS